MLRILIAYLALCAVIGGAYAYLPATGAGLGGPAAAPSTTTWNPSDKDTGITLSGGNLVATSSTTTANCTVTGYCAVRAIASHSTGKYYYEVVPTVIGGSNADQVIGIGTAAAALNLFVGNGETPSIGTSANGTIITSAARCPGISSTTFTNGSVVSVAVDMGGLLIWFRTDAGNWNNNASGDPAAGTIGCDISGLDAPPWFPMVNGSNDNNTVLTANFGATAYAESVPSGYGNW